MTIYASERDVFAFLKCLGDESMDGCITDLPYPTLERHRAIGSTTRLTTDWFPTLPFDALVNVLAEVYRVLKRDSYAFVFVDYESAVLLADAAGASYLRVSGSQGPRDRIGFTWWNPLIWVKTKTSNNPKDLPGTVHPFPEGDDLAAEDIAGGMGYHGRRAYEMILVLEKGKRRLQSFNNVLCAPRYAVQPKGCTIRGTTPKPPSIAAKLAQASTEAGATLFDPFIGCGTIAAGIASTGRSVIVNDMKLDTFEDWMTNHFELPYTRI
jgi:site-specific DNA-methyltransferase (adenine-specific)